MESESGPAAKYQIPSDHTKSVARWWSWLAVRLLVVEVAVCALIIRNVPYTEIDWKAYMQEVEGVLVDGHLDYSKLHGDTGPLVYPAGFVYLFSALWAATEQGRNIERAQWIYAGLYLTSLGLAMAIYRRAILYYYIIPSQSRLVGRRDRDGNKNGSVSPWFQLFILSMLPALCLSRRLHSIYMLRLFNDPWATMFALLAILLLQKQQFRRSCLALSLALSIKMNVLLLVPGFGLILILFVGWRRTALLLSVYLCLPQLILGLPFLSTFPREYLGNAFDLSRQFMYRWTVNWRFVPEHLFLSQLWSRSLLICQAMLSLIFTHFVWLRQRGGLIGFLRDELWASSVVVLEPFTEWEYGNYILDVLFSSQLIGITFSRSLHYQFYSWYVKCLASVNSIRYRYYFTLPFLIWKSVGMIGVDPVNMSPLSFYFNSAMCFLLLGCIEISWNIYPSTSWSSLLLLVCHGILLTTLWLKRKSDWGPSLAEKLKIK